MPPILIDTNLLVYAMDYADIHRQDQAIKVLKRLETTGVGRLSVQNLAEFIHITTRQIRPLLRPSEVIPQVERLGRAFPVLELTYPIILEASRGVRDHLFSYFDAQLWATARLNRIPVIFSEDFSHGAYLEGVQFLNPFLKDFDLETWI